MIYTLMLGQTISHYRVESKLGEGGMGVVYRARDLELNRSVAIKVLSSEVADEERRRRFQQEAQTASSLNHPHILTVYETGAHDGHQYLITEFIDGYTLREWIRREQPSVRQIVELAATIADALACAHQAGIVHRDIKPENILVSRQGYAKLVDFGLAKLVSAPLGEEAPTKTVDVKTRAGVVVGTIPYMSPEQISGKPVDARSDIFSFGAVLYEALVGHRPFAGNSDSELLLSILHSTPRPLSELRPDVPYELRLVVDKSLEKDPAERYQTAREVVIDLKRAQRLRTSEGPLPALPRAKARPKPWIAFMAAAIILALAVSIWLVLRSDFFWRNPLANATFTRLTDFEGSELDAAISPDGKFVTFLSDRDGVFDAFVTQVGSGQFINLTKGRFAELFADAIRNVGFSADGTQVWFRVALSMAPRDVAKQVYLTRVMPTMGGPDRPLLDAGLNPVWCQDGSKLAYHEPTQGDPIFVSDQNGRNPRQIFASQPGVHNHYLAWSPDARFIYFVRGFPPDEMDIWRVSAAGGAPERITRHNSEVAYLAFLDNRTLLYRAPAEDGSGHWLYGIDVDRRIPHRVSFGLEQYLSISASADGRRLVASISNPIANLWTVRLSDHIAREAEARRVSLPTARAVAPRFGPDYLLYLSSRGGADGLWKFKDGVAMELWRAAEGRLVAPPGISPDGRQVCFSRRGQRSQLYVMNADGANLRALAASLDVRDSPSWSPDGRWVAVSADDGKGFRLFKVPVDSGSPVPLTAGFFRLPIWSPDGRYILYSEPRQGAGYPVKAVTPDGKPFPLPPLVVRRGNDRYRILRGGKAILLLQVINGKSDFWSFDLETGRQRQLTDLRPQFSIMGFDVSPDGTEILFDRSREDSDLVLIERPK